MHPDARELPHHCRVADGAHERTSDLEVEAVHGVEPGVVACVAADDELVTRWHPLLDPLALVAGTTEDASGIGAPAEDAVELLLGSEGTAGILRVSTTGLALPSEMLRTDEAGSLDAQFSRWGETEPQPLPADC